MSLKNIRKRHKIVDGIINEIKEPIVVARLNQIKREVMKDEAV